MFICDGYNVAIIEAQCEERSCENRTLCCNKQIHCNGWTKRKDNSIETESGSVELFKAEFVDTIRLVLVIAGFHDTILYHLRL